MKAAFEQDFAGPVDDLLLLHLGELAVGWTGGQFLVGDALLHLRELTLRRAPRRRPCVSRFSCHHATPLSCVGG